MRKKQLVITTMIILALTACNSNEKNEQIEVDEPLEEVEITYPNPEEVAVDAPQRLVNQDHPLPDGYEPENLVYPDVRFIFEEKIEKRMLRADAADALKDLFAAAEEERVFLAGASGYRSNAVQTSLFNQYVERDGEELAKTYSAIPGTSEHETGLAIDVSGSTGECAIEDCFADTAEAKWLAEHAHKHGFIIRYPLGKEEITGYKYEPWHIRYVGKELANELFENNLTLEEYYGVGK